MRENKHKRELAALKQELTDRNTKYQQEIADKDKELADKDKKLTKLNNLHQQEIAELNARIAELESQTR